MPRKNYELIGDDCQIFTAETGAEFTGDGTAALSALASSPTGTTAGKGIYLITAIGSPSFFPAGIRVGEAIPLSGSEILQAGDKVKLLNLTLQADASGWSASVSQDEIDVTRLGSEWKKYRMGKKDFQGTINTITTIGISDEPDGTLGRTFRLVRKDASGTVTVSNPDGLPIYFIGYIRYTDLPGETALFLFAQIVTSGSGVGGSLGSAQSQDLSFRLTGQDPVLYSIDIVATA
ncbi:MAG: hypothetical protein LBP27_07065 [Treponema sp.]|jgi:hypothetical protein|nr:hypothetical protein [Treponema sp.]